MNSARLESGTIIAGKYRIESLLGEGGMGSVYRAEHLILKAPVAIKVIDRALSEGDVALSRFTREAQAAAALRSPHVVQIIDYGTEDERPYMVMELLEGESLADRLDELTYLTASETYRILSHIARAVAKAHESGVVHRDLKPDNVFLIHNEGDEIAKVLDFGVAKVESTQLEGSGHTRTGSLLGTPFYMSPEQAQGNKEIDFRSDLWALGVIAYECLVGQRPFESEGLGDLVLQICIRDIPVPSEHRAIPTGFDEWFKKACARDPGERFQSARELSEALFSALGLAEAPGSQVRESKWSSFAEQKQAREALAGSDGASNAEGAADDQAAGISEAPLPPGVELGGAGNFETAGPSSAAGNQARRKLSHAATIGANEVFSDREPDSSARPSRWEVVPHNQAEQPEASQAGAGASHPATNVASSFDASYQPPSSKMPLLTVGFFAVLLGAGGVYWAKDQGLLDPLLRPAIVEPRVKTDPSPPDAELADSPNQTRKQPSTSKASSAQPVNSGEKAAVQTPAVDEEGHPLDAIEADAARKAEELAKENAEGEEPNAADAETTEGKTGDAKAGDAKAGEPKPTDSKSNSAKPSDATGAATGTTTAATTGKTTPSTGTSTGTSTGSSGGTTGKASGASTSSNNKSNEDGPSPSLPETLQPTPPPPGSN